MHQANAHLLPAWHESIACSRVRPRACGCDAGGRAYPATFNLVAYTPGVPFYLLRRMRWRHPIWHVFVLAGSALP